MKTNSYYPVLCVENVEETADFYKSNFDFTPLFESDWYIHLQMKEDENTNLAVVKYGHPSVPEAYRKPVQGMILNFEFDDVDDIYENLKAKNLPIPLELCDAPWGQRHFIVTDPSGVMVDVIKLIEPTDEFKNLYN